MTQPLDIAPLEEWGLAGAGKPLIIAGPCSAESEEQVLDAARCLAALHVPVFRAGIWKPRTRPGSFEGVGSVGLKWLKRAKAETGMLLATEVANVKHVYQALSAGIDIIWIGARTTVNPFAIQEIADALGGVDIPVLVKNPVNPDIELWMGAIERIRGAGIRRVGAVHRGFSGVDRSDYRNDPQWQIPIEVRRRVPQMLMLCDPSHISGRSDLIAEVAQRAMNLNYDGLMIESHCKPAEAWSDAAQQITPAQLGELLTQLVARRETADDTDYTRRLNELRHQIDECDDALLALLARRMEVAKDIGKLKKANNVTVLQRSRWDEIVQRSHNKAKAHGFSIDFVDTLFKAIHQESINKQQQILSGENGN